MLLLASKLKNLPSRKSLLSVDERAEPGPGGGSVIPAWRGSTGTGSCCGMSPRLPNCYQVLFDLPSPGFPVSLPPSALGQLCFACELLFRAATAAQRHLDIFRNHLFVPNTCCSWSPVPVVSLPRVCVKVYPEGSPGLGCRGHSLP